MAFATPLEIPSGLKFRSRKFNIGYFQQITPGGRGLLQTINRASPAWVAEYETPPLEGEDYNESITFLDKMEEAIESFLAYDPRRPMPYAYRGQSLATDPWTQTGQVAPRVTAFSFPNSTLTLDRLENGAIITAGDYISFLVGKLWYLFRASDTVVAAANTALVTVKPRPDISGTIPVNIRYRKACCQMKIIGGVEEQDSVETFPSLSFRAVQMMDRS